MLENVHGVEAWYGYLMERAASSTAKTYVRSLKVFCEKYYLNPEELLSLDSSTIETLLADFAESVGKDGSIRPVVFAVKSWLAFNGKKVYSRMFSNRENISWDEIQKVISHSPPRIRVILSLMAFSGLPTIVIGNVKGSDGLRIRDLPEFDIEELKFRKVPALIVVRKELHKIEHVTFAGRTTCDCIVEYLKGREEQGEKLTENSPLVEKKGGFFINAAYVSKLASQAIVNSGLDFYPKDLREYFTRSLQRAVNTKLVPAEYAEIWLGMREIKGASISFDVLEDMRSKFDYMERLSLEPLEPQNLQ